MIVAALGALAKTRSHLSVEGLLNGYRRWVHTVQYFSALKREEIMSRRATGEKEETVPPRGLRETGRDKGHSLPVKSINVHK